MYQKKKTLIEITKHSNPFFSRENISYYIIIINNPTITLFPFTFVIEYVNLKTASSNSRGYLPLLFTNMFAFFPFYFLYFLLSFRSSFISYFSPVLYISSLYNFSFLFPFFLSFSNLSFTFPFIYFSFFLSFF